jgi:hypothetical protein
MKHSCYEFSTFNEDVFEIGRLQWGTRKTSNFALNETTHIFWGKNNGRERTLCLFIRFGPLEHRYQARFWFLRYSRALVEGYSPSFWIDRSCKTQRNELLNGLRGIESRHNRYFKSDSTVSTTPPKTWDIDLNKVRRLLLSLANILF